MANIRLDDRQLGLEAARRYCDAALWSMLGHQIAGLEQALRTNRRPQHAVSVGPAYNEWFQYAQFAVVLLELLFRSKQVRMRIGSAQDLLLQKDPPESFCDGVTFV